MVEILLWKKYIGETDHPNVEVASSLAAVGFD